MKQFSEQLQQRSPRKVVSNFLSIHTQTHLFCLFHRQSSCKHWAASSAALQAFLPETAVEMAAIEWDGMGRSLRPTWRRASVRAFQAEESPIVRCQRCVCSSPEVSAEGPAAASISLSSKWERSLGTGPAAAIFSGPGWRIRGSGQSTGHSLTCDHRRAAAAEHKQVSLAQKLH